VPAAAAPSYASLIDEYYELAVAAAEDLQPTRTA
jgi:hypothetical protein